MQQESLARVYLSIIRPVAEYAAVAWPSMLSLEQSNELERQQTQALKNILGPGISAAKMREKLGVELLAVRRERAAVIKLASKCASSSRFCGWFPMRLQPSYPRREGVSYNLYLEETCRTERRKNSPLCDMKRKLNNQ